MLTDFTTFVAVVPSLATRWFMIFTEYFSNLSLFNLIWNELWAYHYWNQNYKIRYGITIAAMWCSVVTYLWQMQQHFDLLRNILNLLNNYKATLIFRWGIKEKFSPYIHSSYLCVGRYIISAAGFSLWIICNLSR